MRFLKQIPFIFLLLFGCAPDSHLLVCGTFSGKLPSDVDIKVRNISLNKLQKGPKMYYIFHGNEFAIIMEPEDVIDVLGGEDYVERYNSKKYINIIETNPLISKYTDLNVYIFLDSNFRNVVEKLVFDMMSMGKAEIIVLNKRREKLDQIVQYSITQSAGSGVQYCTTDGHQIAERVLTIVDDFNHE